MQSKFGYILNIYWFSLWQKGTRHDGQIAVFGPAFQEKLERQKYFLVRAGLVFVQQGAHSALKCSAPSVLSFDPAWCWWWHMQEMAVIQVAFPASVDLLVCRDCSAVPSPFSVSFENVIFAVVYWLTVCLREGESASMRLLCHCLQGVRKQNRPTDESFSAALLKTNDVFIAVKHGLYLMITKQKYLYKNIF